MLGHCTYGPLRQESEEALMSDYAVIDPTAFTTEQLIGAARGEVKALKLHPPSSCLGRSRATLRSSSLLTWLATAPLILGSSSEVLSVTQEPDQEGRRGLRATLLAPCLGSGTPPRWSWHRFPLHGRPLSRFDVFRAARRGRRSKGATAITSRGLSTMLLRLFGHILHQAISIVTP
jgi:hypothetical protein